MADKVVMDALEGVIEEGASGQPEPQAQNMDVLESYEGERVNSEVIFGGEGRSLRAARMNTEQKRKLAKVAGVYKDVVEGYTPMRTLFEATRQSQLATQLVQETMMSSEFSYLLNQTLDRILLARYGTYQPSYRNFLRIRRVRDFRTVGSVRRSGGGGLEAVAEGTTYPQGSVSESSYTYAVAKYGKTYSLTWEGIINDDLDAFETLPDDMANDAVQEEMYFASSLYVNNTTLYATNHSAAGTTWSNKGTSAFTIENLITAVSEMAKYPGDANDDGTYKPVNNMVVHLVVPPALRLDAAQALGSSQLIYSGGDSQTGISAVAYGMNNPLFGQLMIHVDPYIPVVDSTNGHTSWYLFADVSQGHAAEVGFLRGYEQPQLFRKAPNVVGGDPNDGDFDTDSIWWKIRHVFGGSHANAAGNWRFTYWSDGTA